MAISIGNTTDSRSINTFPATFSHNNNGSVLALSVSLLDLNNLANITATYNGISMISGVQANRGPGTLSVSAIFYLVSPAQGSNTVSISSSGTPQKVRAAAISMLGGDTTTIIGANAAQTGNQNAPWTQVITTQKDHSLIVDNLISDNGNGASSIVANNGQTTIFASVPAEANIWAAGYVSIPAAGSYTDGYTYSPLIVGTTTFVLTSLEFISGPNVLDGLSRHIRPKPFAPGRAR